MAAIDKCAGNIAIKLHFEDGSSRDAVIPSGAVGVVQRYARMMPFLFEGTGFNPLNADCDRIVAVTRADHDLIHQIPGAEKKAIFRLGQMDMQQSVRQMLLDAAAQHPPTVVRAALLSAASMVEAMTVDDGGSG